MMEETHNKSHPYYGHSEDFVKNKIYASDRNPNGSGLDGITKKAPFHAGKGPYSLQMTDYFTAYNSSQESE